MLNQIHSRKDSAGRRHVYAELNGPQCVSDWDKLAEIFTFIIVLLNFLLFSQHSISQRRRQHVHLDISPVVTWPCASLNSCTATVLMTVEIKPTKRTVVSHCFVVNNFRCSLVHISRTVGSKWTPIIWSSPIQFQAIYLQQGNISWQALKDYLKITQFIIHTATMSFCVFLAFTWNSSCPSQKDEKSTVPKSELKLVS